MEKGDESLDVLDLAKKCSFLHRDGLRFLWEFQDGGFLSRLLQRYWLTLVKCRKIYSTFDFQSDFTKRLGVILGIRACFLKIIIALILTIPLRCMPQSFKKPLPTYLNPKTHILGTVFLTHKEKAIMLLQKQKGDLILLFWTS